MSANEMFGVVLNGLSVLTILGALVAIARVRRPVALRPTPTPPQSPYRTPGGNPGDRAIDAMLDALDALKKPATSTADGDDDDPLVRHLALEHRVEQLTDAVERLDARLRLFETSTATLFGKITATLLAAVFGAFLTEVAYHLLWR